MNKLAMILSSALLLAGCSGYRWTSAVPEGMRTVYVPTFRNESDSTEAGSFATRQILREFQREGTFRLVASREEAAIEVRGTVTSVSLGDAARDHRIGARRVGYTETIAATVTVVDLRDGKVLINQRPYRGETNVSSGRDTSTASRVAAERAADDLAQRLVDDILQLKDWRK